MGYDLYKIHIVAFIYFNFDVNVFCFFFFFVFFVFGFTSFLLLLKFFWFKDSNYLIIQFRLI